MANSSLPSDSPALAVRHVEKRFGSVRALTGASFELKRGELLGLLGPNGAGKTTMIRGIAGRARLDAGEVLLLGRTLTAADPRPEIGVVPQELAIYKRLTARENLSAFGRLAGVPPGRIRERVQWALDWSDLGERADEPIERFSGGMKRRLNIACSLLHEPSVVLLDEPTVGVDPQSRGRIYEMLAALRERGVSIVLTTHHLEEAEQRCDRIAIIDKGTCVAAGTVAELVRGSVGASRRVDVTLGSPWPHGAAVPPGATLADDRLELRATVNDIGGELPALLGHVAAAGARLDDVKLAGATLQDVFIALTGRELRE
jgi:ABC-2 type transport system ATP-binding protein